MPTALLRVSGLRGAEDEARLERALQAEPGVFGAVANHQDGCAEIDFEDDEVTVEQLIEVAESAGFGATLAG